MSLKKAIRDEVIDAGVTSDNITKLADSMAYHLVSSRSKGTVSKYYGAFKRWTNFAQSNGMDSIPAQPIHVSLYLTYLIDKHSSFSVLQSAFYAIKWAHKMRGLDDPTGNHFVVNLLESAKRQNSKPKIRKQPVGSDQIIQLCDKYVHSKDILVLRDLSMILLCFAGFLRFDEISSLLCKDVQIFENHLSLFLRKSKTDQYREGSTVVISKGSTAACPISCLNRYLSEANIKLDSDHFLFKPAYSSKGVCSFVHVNKPISYTRARETIVKRLKEVYGEANLGLHSMRSWGLYGSKISG